MSDQISRDGQRAPAHSRNIIYSPLNPLEILKTNPSPIFGEKTTKGYRPPVLRVLPQHGLSLPDCSTWIFPVLLWSALLNRPAWSCVLFCSLMNMTSGFVSADAWESRQYIFICKKLIILPGVLSVATSTRLYLDAVPPLKAFLNSFQSSLSALPPVILWS